MGGYDPTRGDVLPPEQVYAVILHRVEAVAADSLLRLRELSERFPTAVPPALVEELERACADPAGERRCAVRLAGGPEVLPVRVDPTRGLTRATVLDRSPGGVSLRLVE